MKRIKSVLARVLVTSMVLGLLPIGQASGSDAAAKIKLSGKKLTVTKGKTKKLSVKNAKKYSCFENEIKMWVYEELIEGKKLSEIYKDIKAECGDIYMEERDYKFNQEKKDAIYRILMEEKRLPELDFEMDKISYLDGSKVYLKNGGWVVARFSGTEPLLRIFCEMPKAEDAKKIVETYEKFLDL